jgi:hypothetical protein
MKVGGAIFGSIFTTADRYRRKLIVGNDLVNLMPQETTTYVGTLKKLPA